MEQNADPSLLSRIKWSQHVQPPAWLVLLHGFYFKVGEDAMSGWAKGKHGHRVHIPHELLELSSSGWLLSRHRCHHSRHLNTWLRPWRRRGRGWSGDPPFCQKRHAWVWEHYHISSKTANTNRNGKRVLWLIISLCNRVLKDQTDNYEIFGNSRTVNHRVTRALTHMHPTSTQGPWKTVWQHLRAPAGGGGGQSCNHLISMH